MVSRAEESDPSEPRAGVATIDEPMIDPPATEARAQLPPPPRVPPDAPPRTPTGPSFGDRIVRFFRFLLRLVLLLAALTVIGVALYYLVPLFYDSFVRPVEQNTVDVRQLQSRQDQAEQELTDLQSRLETLEDVQNQHDESLTDVNRRLSDIETEIAARTESLATLEQMQTELQEQNEAATTELERQLNLLKAMELLSRARLFMYQSNFGLARQDVQIARDVLASVQPDTPEDLAPDLDAVLQRLDMTLSNLPNFPVAASDDLDIAWQILLSGVPEGTPTLVGTPVPSLAGTISATPTAVPTSTPEPIGTRSATPTALPTFTPTPAGVVSPSPT